MEYYTARYAYELLTQDVDAATTHSAALAVMLADGEADCRYQLIANVLKSIQDVLRMYGVPDNKAVTTISKAEVPPDLLDDFDEEGCMKCPTRKEARNERNY